MLVECVCAGDPQACICEASVLVHMTLVSEHTAMGALAVFSSFFSWEITELPSPNHG